MQLQLKYSPGNRADVRAVLLQGNDPAGWMRMVRSWTIDPSLLTCYPVPASLQDNRCDGLFVIWPEGTATQEWLLPDPYQRIGKKLFIPLEAELLPRMQAEESDALLRWDIQLLHPVKGLTGFALADAVPLTELFAYSFPVSADWSFASMGAVKAPVLQSITVVPPPAEELMKEIQREIGQKPLSDLPELKDQPSNPVEKLADAVSRFFLRGFVKAVEGMASRAGNAGDYSGQAKETWLSRLFNRAVEKLEELEAKRKKEIERLLDLFDKDPNEALQFALPLDSQYADRGPDAGGSQLTRRPVRFSLGGLGGGGVGSAWDIGENYHRLRTKYIAAAERAIREKDFKKAAYIYAHLLNDYTAAANVLEQGGHFRDAAVLYRDHLKNKIAAAGCLERGGLYFEAIDLYLGEKMFEAAGDAWQKMDNTTEANRCYGQAVQEHLNKRDYLAGAKLQETKMHDLPAARTTLLEGWQHTLQDEACLQHYFESYQSATPEERLQVLDTIYADKVPVTKQKPFLSVLNSRFKKESDEMVKSRTEAIAYELVHALHTKGDTSALRQLPAFVPGDPLVAPDIRRYQSLVAERPLAAVDKEFTLDNTYRWTSGCWHRNQYFALGQKNFQTLMLARFNKTGHIEYYSYVYDLEKTQAEDKWMLVSEGLLLNAPLKSNQLILVAPDVTGLGEVRTFFRNKYFPDAAVLRSPSWMYNLDPCRVAVTKDDEIAALTFNGTTGTLQYYKDGKLTRSAHVPGSEDLRMFRGCGPMVPWEDKFIVHSLNDLAIVSEEGWKPLNIAGGVLVFELAPFFHQEYMIVYNGDGGQLFRISSDPELISTFKVDYVPYLVRFILKTQFILVTGEKMSRFEITGNHAQLLKEYPLREKIIAVFPGNDFDCFITLNEMGACKVWQ